MKTSSLILVLAGMVAGLPAHAQQADGNWMVRLRATHTDMINHSDEGMGLLTPADLPKDAIAADNKTIPEVDVTYFFNSSLAAELSLTVPQKHDLDIVKGRLAEPIGSFKYMPTTLMLQYQFNITDNILPYFGLGLTYSDFSSTDLTSTIGGGDLHLENESFGEAYQAGVDFRLPNNFFLNADMTKRFIDTDVNVQQGKVSHIELNPLGLSLGIGKRF